ncbi:DUF2092 domain-containing protein [Edaphosphingomonas haloaromaticamans]|uniref:DUF2092 domain-containing protein n=1 Tax=Edaphosphingomonas haloaromaticamans TaxID=653954 RepID=A0A1S1HAJ7_9SPHN|nr:DUF2092 domain-containing protein [Sphingomonas haloaromaticamans]OHT18656.1 hypothetical protein BHE75_00630 [Sphingomonas haloaromaticamans]
MSITIPRDAFAAASLAALLALAVPASPAAMAAPDPAAARSGSIDPVAVKAFEAFRAYLRQINSFELRAETTIDDVVGDDLKVQYSGRVRYEFSKPDKLFVDWRSDRMIRRLYYDGKALTIYAPRYGYFATISRTGAVGDLLVDAAEKYDLIFPLPDFFYWAAGHDTADDLQEAVYVGYARIAGVDTDQYLYRQSDLDWQIWIQRGSQPLPRKIVITSRNDPMKPAFSALLQWNPGVALPADHFTFKPTAAVTPVKLSTVAEQGDRP